MSPHGRQRLRLVLRDASATAAFASIVLSGSVPAWALAAYVLALGTSLLGRRPLSMRPTISVILLLLTGFLLFGAVFRGLMDLVVAACTFAGLVTSHRMLSEPSTGTDQQVHLTSLLMLAGGAALTGELWFGVCLAIFALCSTLSLGLGVLEPEGGTEDHLEIRPVMSRVAIGTAIAIAGGIAFFALFPRLSWNVAGRRASPGLGGTTGMSDRITLGGAGDIKSSPRVVARVTLDPDPHTERLDAYFVGRSFDTFKGREWTGSGRTQPTRPSVRLSDQPKQPLVTQQIELVPGYDSRTLIALDRPVHYSAAYAIGSAGPQRTGLIEVSDEEVHFSTGANAFTYSAASVLPDQAVPQTLDRPARYDQPPEDLDPRVGQLAEHVLGAERRPLQAARLLQRFLQRDYAYSLELSDAADPVTDFLFVRKAGHCEHFATALALLLRSQHLAARVTAGFFGGERLGEQYVIRAGDAHAWTQVFVPGEGWVTVDATPDSGRSSRPSAVLAWLTNRYEQLQQWWRLRVVDYSFQDQVEIARSLVRPPRERGAARWSLPSLGGAGRVASALALGVAVYVLVQRLGRKALRRRHAATSFLDEIETRLQRAGIARLPDEAIEELTSRLSEGAHPIAPALSKATRAYLRARFGGGALPAADRAELLARLR